MTIIQQTDPRWSNIRLGSTPFVLARWGCTTSCISMVAFRFNEGVFPDEIARWNECYNADGKIIWANLNVHFKRLKFQKRLRVFSPGLINADLKDPNRAVLFEVNNGSHWLVAERKMWLRDDYICADPFLGRFVASKGDYHNITGSAHFIHF